MFGDLKDKYLDIFEVLLRESTLEEYLEEEDLTPEEALYFLFISGNIRDPKDLRSVNPAELVTSERA